MDAGKKFLNEFIDCYELCESLWNTSSPDYTSRHLKLNAYTKLLKVMKKYKKDACITDVKKKINTLRSNYRREMKRIRISESRGDETIYTPNLWWFEKFSFLRNLKNPKQSTNTNAKQQEIFVEEFLFDDEEQGDESDLGDNLELRYEDIQSKRRRLEETYIQPSSTKKIKKQDDNLLINYNVLPKPGGDTFDHMCKAWAGNLREMDKHQRIIAGRAISEIIFQGQLGVLSFDSIPKMPVNAYNSSSQTVTNSTRVSTDNIECSTNKSRELNYQRCRTQSREHSPKSTSKFSSATLQNQQMIERPPISIPAQKNEFTKNEYTTSEMEQQTFSGQFYDQ